MTISAASIGTPIARWLAVALFSACALAFAAEPIAPVNRLPRVALVIGNAKYPQAPLKNPHNDASAMAEQLKRMGFDVTVKLDATKSDMEGLIRAFGTKLRQHNGVGFFYFAGHGAQLSWRNYLIPVDAAIANVADMQKQAVDLGTLLDTFDFARNPVNVVVLDACRDNPLGNDVRLEQKGFSQVDAPPGTLLAYATAPGNVSADGARANGLYTESLLKEMVTPDAKIEDVLKRVRLAVRRESRGQQIPWESTSLEHDFYFVAPMSAKKPSTEAGEREFETELAQWEKIRHTRESALLEDYLRQYPGGRFSELAQFRLDQVLQLHGEKRIQTATVAAANPLSKGTAVADVSYTIGDRYAYRRVDALTKAEDRRYTLRVTQVTDTEVMYNEGANITDLLGNIIKNPRRDFTGIRQFYVPEYSIGKKWKTRFHAESKDLGVNKTWIVDAEFKVVAKDQVTVPAGTFDAYKVEGRGSNTLGQRLVLNYWIAPDRVRAPLMLESIFYNNKGTVFESSRDELVSYTQLRQPGEVK